MSIYSVGALALIYSPLVLCVVLAVKDSVRERSLRERVRRGRR